MPEGNEQPQPFAPGELEITRPPLTFADVDVAIVAARVGIISDGSIESLRRLSLLQGPDAAQQVYLGGALGRIGVDAFDRELES